MNKLIIIAIVLIIGAYLITPIPYCRIVDERIEGEPIYTAEEILETKEKEIFLLKTKGTSMLPVIQDNSECLCLKKNNYEINDIVFFFIKLNDELIGISHRIISIDYKEIITKGDNNDLPDAPMTKENIACAIPYVPRYRVLF